MTTLTAEAPDSTEQTAAEQPENLVVTQQFSERVIDLRFAEYERLYDAIPGTPVEDAFEKVQLLDGDYDVWGIKAKQAAIDALRLSPIPEGLLGKLFEIEGQVCVVADRLPTATVGFWTVVRSDSNVIDDDLPEAEILEAIAAYAQAENTADADLIESLGA